jgi:hypothetical protein
MFALGEPKEEQRDRSNKTGCRWNGKTRESVLMIGSVVLGCRGIKTGKAQRSAG